MKIVGFDISTSKIGYSITEKVNNEIKLVKQDVIDVSKLSPNNEHPDFYTIFDKIDLAQPILSKIIVENGIDKIMIESPARKFGNAQSSIDTLYKLILFNFTLSNFLYKITGIRPIHIDPRSARVKVFGKGINSKKGNKINIKEKCFEILCSMYPELNSYKSNTNRNGNIYPWVYDISDSIVVSISGHYS